MVDLDLDAIGDPTDAVQVLIDGTPITIYEDYDVQMSVLQQPAAFTLRLGWSDVARDLLNLAAPGREFELRVKGVVIQSGRIDGRRLRSGESGTFVEVKGRDWMAALYDSFVKEERSFADATYEKLTRTVLDLCGLKEPRHGLLVSDLARTKAIAGFQTIKVVNEETIKEIETGAAVTTQTKVVNKTLKAKLGERWYDWLQRQFKLKGLFLWCTGEGNFVLSEPEWDQEPAFTILRARGTDPGHEYSTVLDVDWNDDTTHRHSRVTVHGRGGGGAAGRAKVKGVHDDADMLERGIVKELVVHDEDCKTPEQCAFVARRTSAEERRAGWTLEYTLSGHTVPSIKGGGDAIWGPNLVARVSDDEIPLDGTFWIERVGFSRKPHTTTNITLMRPGDLVFGSPEKANRAPKPKRHPKL